MIRPILDIFILIQLGESLYYMISISISNLINASISFCQGIVILLTSISAIKNIRKHNLSRSRL
jgi:hypothetical protein